MAEVIIQADITGVGDIVSAVTVIDAIRINGYCRGAGFVSSIFNFSRRKSLYPALRRDVSYRSKDAPIVAIEYVDFSPNKVINITSYEDSKFENTAEFYLIETIESADGIFFPSKHYPYSDSSSGLIDYLVTDKTTRLSKVPLFYQYELLYDVYSVENGKVVTLYKNNEVKLDPSEYVIECSYDLLGSGSIRYDNTVWNPLDLSKKLHRVRLLLPISVANKDDFFNVDYDKSIYGARSPQRELLELKPIYNQTTDYIVTSGVILTSSSKIKDNTTILYMIKDIDDRIKPFGIDPPVYQPDAISSWRLRLNHGSLLTQSGLYNDESERFYKLSNKYSHDYIPITNVKPIYISENIIRVGQYPIFIDETTYKFPLYQIDLYDKTDFHLNSTKGNISIEVNGVSRLDLKILSIDRQKGYIHLNKVINSTDEIELNFYVDPAHHIILENLELNPKLTSGSEFYKISGFANGLGIALREYDPNNDYTHYVYIYDASLPELTRPYYMIPEVGETGILPVTGENFFSICELELNRLSPDMIKITDARRIGGGINDMKELDKWFINNSSLNIRDKDSYIGNAFYGGDPTSFANTIIIHVPSGVLYSARDRWIGSLSGVVNDSIEQKERGIREFNFYLDQVIKRYISAGTDYMLIPIDVNGNFMNIVNLSYNYSV